MPPSIQLLENTSKIEVVWELDATPGIVSFNLYHATARNGAGTLLIGNIPNQGRMHHGKYAGYKFHRSDLSLTESDYFFLFLKSVNGAGVESAAGESRMIPPRITTPYSMGGANSPLISTEKYSESIPGTPTRLTFARDAKAIEFYNEGPDSVFFDFSGEDADVLESLKLTMGSFYSAEMAIPRDTGVSLVSDGSSDVRIYVHY